MNVQSRIVSGLALALAACAVEADGEAGPLATRRVLAVLQAGDLHLSAHREGDAMPAVEPRVEGGTIVVRTLGAHLLLEELDMRLGDVDVVKTYAGTTQVLRLTGLRLRLGTRADALAAWSDDRTAVSGAATADLLLDWSLRTRDGDAIPLATQRIAGAVLDVHVLNVAVSDDLSDGAVASVGSTVAGPVWELGDITVSDLSLSLVTTEGEIR